MRCLKNNKIVYRHLNVCSLYEREKRCQIIIPIAASFYVLVLGKKIESCCPSLATLHYRCSTQKRHKDLANLYTMKLCLSFSLSILLYITQSREYKMYKVLHATINLEMCVHGDQLITKRSTACLMFGDFFPFFLLFPSLIVCLYMYWYRIGTYLWWPNMDTQRHLLIYVQVSLLLPLTASPSICTHTFGMHSTLFLCLSLCFSFLRVCFWLSFLCISLGAKF